MAKKQCGLPDKLLVCLRKGRKQGKSMTILALAGLLMPNPKQADAEWFEPERSQIGETNLTEGPIGTWNSDIYVVSPFSSMFASLEDDR